MCVHNTSNAVKYAVCTIYYYFIIKYYNNVCGGGIVLYVQFKSHKPIDNMLVPLYVM